MDMAGLPVGGNDFGGQVRPRIKSGRCKVTRRRWLLSVLAIGLMPWSQLPAQAQAPQAKRIRGTVESVSGDILTVKPFDGVPVAIQLAPNWSVTTVAPLKLEDIKPSSFVGVGAAGLDSRLVALQVMVFPESMRGTGEGHYPWAARPENSMTNANVEGTAAQANGRELTLTFKGNSLKMFVPPEAAIYALAIGEKAMVVPGAKVTVAATVGPDARMTAARVTVAINGADPPI
jgi:hypothetical protein